MMKVVRSGFTAAATVLAILFATSSQAEDASRVEYPNRSLQARIQYCKTCHGMTGQGYRGFYAMPRLAGQQTEYFVNQLKAFADRKRQNRFMYGVARVLNPAMESALAAHFHGLNPGPLGGAPRNLMAAGKKIFEEGIPETNVPACMACHGENAQGKGEIPRLAGQLHDYILDKLTNWERDRGRSGAGSADASAVMLPTSHALTRSQISQVAAYVSNLR
jgi:cytochrome c553